MPDETKPEVPTYILKTGVKAWPYSTTTELAARFSDVMRDVGRIGPFRHVESIGRDETLLQVSPAGRTGRSPSGNTSGSFHCEVRRSADALHRKVRIVPDTVVAEIATLDDEIADLNAQLVALREQRALAVKRAWARGKQVPLREVVDLALQRDDRRETVRS